MNSRETSTQSPLVRLSAGEMARRIAVGEETTREVVEAHIRPGFRICSTIGSPLRSISRVTV